MKFENVSVLSLKILNRTLKIFGIYAITHDKPLKSVDNFVENHPKSMKFLGTSFVIISYLAMVLAVLLVIFTILLAANMEAKDPSTDLPPAQVIIPINFGAIANNLPEGTLNKGILESIARYVYYVPFLPFFIAILIIVVFHEGAHYLMMRRNKIEIKDYGFGILNFLYIPLPVPLAFVQQAKEEYGYPMVEVAAAGSGMNFLLTAIFFIPYALFGGLTLFYLVLLNFAVGLTNVLPIHLVDGSYMIRPLIGNKGLHLSSLIIIGLVIVPSIITWEMKKKYMDKYGIDSLINLKIASRSKLDVFVTLNQSMLNDREELEKKFRIKKRTPKEMLGIWMKKRFSIM